MTTPFITFPFAATGGSATRTMPARLHDEINVLDYGADNTGASNTVTAINAAVAAAAASGTTAAGKKGGTVKFPPGLYLVNGQIQNTAANTTVSLVGSGKYNTVLQGTNNSGFIIRAFVGSQFDIQRVASMSVINLSTTAATGGLRFQQTDGAKATDCYIKGMVALDMADGCFNSGAYNCEIVGPGYAVSGGLCCSLGQAGLYGCKLSGAERAIGMWNGGSTVNGCYIANCTIGLDAGFWYAGVGSIVAWALSGCVFDRCTRAIQLGVASGTRAGSGSMTGNLIQGSVGPNGSTPPEYGIYALNAVAVASIANSVTAACSIGGISVAGNNGGMSFYNTTSTIVGGTGAAWIMPTSAYRNYVFSGSDNPTTARPLADWGTALTIEGEEHDITDGTAVGWGNTAVGGGILHQHIRSNGTNWTVMG